MFRRILENSPERASDDRRLQSIVDRLKFLDRSCFTAAGVLEENGAVSPPSYSDSAYVGRIAAELQLSKTDFTEMDMGQIGSVFYALLIAAIEGVQECLPSH